MQNTKHKKLVAAFILLGVAMLIFAAVSNFALAAQELENQYPKIPLPGFGNFSLNELASTTPPGALAGKDPLSLLILYFYSLAVAIVGLVAFGMIIIAGFKFLTSGANPGLRNQAKGQAQAVILGIALLLGSWIILNTINPELTIINVPRADEAFLGMKWPGVASVDIDSSTLRYGGVVLYGDANIDGSSGKSEVVFNDIENFDNATWIGNNLSAIRIEGDCDILLFQHADFSGTAWSVNGPTTSTLWSVNGPTTSTLATLTIPNDEPSSLQFVKRDCLGNSITVYADEEYIGGTDKGTMPIIYDDEEIRGDLLRPSLEAPGKNVSTPHADNEIDSIRFARPDLTNVNALMCTDKDFVGQCSELSEDTPRLTEIDAALHDSISSIRLGGSGKDRQAGLILYNKEKFQGVSEILIASDAKIDHGNIVNRDAPGEAEGGEWISSLRIIGKYKVTIYDAEGFDDTQNWIEIDNTSGVPEFSFSTGSSIIEGKSEADFYRGIIEIPKLSEFVHPDGDWNDKVKSIKIERPQP